MKQREIKTNKNKLRSLILSFIISIAAWSVITYMTDVDISKKISGIRIEVAGQETLAQNGLVVANENELPKVSVKIRGKRSDLIKALDNVGAAVDVSEITEPGDYLIDVSAKIPINRISVDNVKDSAVKVSVQKLESKEFPVTVYQSSYVEGKVIESVPKTEKITVRGTASELEKISGVCVTVDLMTMESKQTLPLSFMVNEDTDIEDLGTLKMSKDTVEVENITYDAISIMVNPQVAPGVGRELDLAATEINPSTVVAGISGVAESESVTVIIDEYTEEEKEYEVILPDGVYVQSEHRKVKIKPVWK